MDNENKEMNQNEFVSDAEENISDGYSDSKPSEYTETEFSEPHVKERPASKTSRKKSSSGNRLGVRICALALCTALIGGAAGSGLTLLIQSRRTENSTQAQTVDTSDGSTENNEKDSENSAENGLAAEIQTPTVVTTSSSGSLLTPSDVYANNVASTVGIQTSISTNYWGYQTTSAASGSGFILTDDGYILTNYHVIEDASSITVMTYDDESYTAELIGYDESNDIAVLKIEAQGLTPVSIGDSDALKVGDQVVAIGNPLGELTFSLTSGYVSALDREITLSSSLTMNLIQTDCAINSGNSGGPLFNMYGQVIGITNAKLSSSSSSSSASIDNIGFAIPINSVMNIVNSIIENGCIVKPYIGITISTVSSDAQNYGIPSGAAVRAVTEGSPAEAAGLQVNDVITAVDDEAISDSSELISIVGDCAAGDVLTLSVYRSGETVEITVVVGEQTVSALPSSDTADDNAETGTENQNSETNPFGGFGFPGGQNGEGNR